MAAKKSSSSKSPTPAQLAALKKTKVGSIKPDTAITKKGQKATGLASPRGTDRYSTTAKTPIRPAQSGLRGTGTPLNVSLGYKPTKGNVVNAALTATGVKGTGVVAKTVGKAAGKFVGNKAFPILAKGLEASGMGGKIYGALTPQGRAIASTAIGTSAQQAARMENLTKIAVSRSNQIASSVAKDVAKGVSIGGRAVSIVAAKAVNKPTTPQPKSKPKKK